MRKQDNIISLPRDEMFFAKKKHELIIDFEGQKRNQIAGFQCHAIQNRSK